MKRMEQVGRNMRQISSVNMAWVLYYPYPQHNVRVSVESLMFQNAELRSGGSPSWYNYLLQAGCGIHVSKSGLRYNV